MNFWKSQQHDIKFFHFFERNINELIIFQRNINLLIYDCCFNRKNTGLDYNNELQREQSSRSNRTREARVELLFPGKK